MRCQWHQNVTQISQSPSSTPTRSWCSMALPRQKGKPWCSLYTYIYTSICIYIYIIYIYILLSYSCPTCETGIPDHWHVRYQLCHWPSPPQNNLTAQKQETIRLTKRPRTTCILCMKSYFVYHINLVCKENSNPPTRFENKNQRGLHRGPHWLLRNPIAVQNPIKI